MEKEKEILLSDKSGAPHNWVKSRFLLTPTWCYCCREYITHNVLSCSKCISTVHERCVSDYESLIGCKGQRAHGFVLKSLHMPAICLVCDKVVHIGFEVKICIYCQAVVHLETCEALAPKLCSERVKTGPYRCDICLAGKCQYSRIKNQVVELVENNLQSSLLEGELVHEKVESEMLSKSSEILDLNATAPNDSASEIASPLRQAVSDVPRRTLSKIFQFFSLNKDDTASTTAASSTAASHLDSTSCSNIETIASLPNSSRSATITNDPGKTVPQPDIPLSPSGAIQLDLPANDPQPTLDIDTLSGNYQLLEARLAENEVEHFELCTSPVRCTCQCNVGSFHDVMQKSAAVGLGLGLVTGAIVVSVLTAGVATPLVVASVGVTAGIVGGVGTSSAFHGTASLIKGQKINGSDYAFDLGLGAVTGAISGGVGVGFSAAATAASSAATASIPAFNEAGRLGIQGAMKVTSGVSSSVAGKLVSDGLEVGLGRKKEEDFGKDLHVSALTGGVGGLISMGADTLSKATAAELQAVGGLGARKTAEVFIEGSKNIVSDSVKYETRAALGVEKKDKHEDVVFGAINEKITRIGDAILHSSSSSNSSITSRSGDLSDEEWVVLENDTLSELQLPNNGDKNDDVDNMVVDRKEKSSS